MLEITSPAQELVLGVDFAEVYKSSSLYRRNKALITELSAPHPGFKDLYFPTQYSQSFFTQCIACLWKQHWSYWRNPPYTAVRFIFTTFIAHVWYDFLGPWFQKVKATRSFQCYGFYVYCYSLPRSPKCLISAASGGC
ncbi:hypothetical protein RHMOL_Rhmol08G0291800 [Rhododendron molle]|uniref:Uncharacterized protein n=1 Tax=Rhododendron molle TaxID=49168 RepID=A0ACC0MV64_RHOML|nr:hypothetical protein RHMOL_Rhmol08G0291800 [Rhododendron molle]